MTDPADVAARLEQLLAGEVTDVQRLLGGASRETWAFRLDGRPLVVRRDPPGSPRRGGMPREAALLRAAAAAGVPVPAVLAGDADCVVVEWLDGETVARRILRDDAYAAARPRLVPQAAAALAALHRGVGPDAVPDLPRPVDPLSALREQLDALGEPHPALELGLSRLAASLPPPAPAVVVHGDFRLGNWMVGPAGLVGVLDWELAHVGDRAEDLGWMCVRSWRFGGSHPVAGLGDREELLSAYAEAGGVPVDPATLGWWEAYGTARWGVICAQQAAAHLSGAVRSVELAAIGRRIAEVELDLLELLEPAAVAASVSAAQSAAEPVAGSGPHDRPTAPELLESVREWLETLPLDGADAFLRRVAGRSLDIVAREMTLGPALAAAHRARLSRLGVGSDAELAREVRAGRDDPATVAAITAAVVDKVLVADPRQLDR